MIDRLCVADFGYHALLAVGFDSDPSYLFHDSRVFMIQYREVGPYMDSQVVEERDRRR